jgi:hypothetical protein
VGQAVTVLRPMTDHDAELDAIAAELEAAGILTVTTDDGSVVGLWRRPSGP